jgi:hypothetical protein
MIFTWQDGAAFKSGKAGTAICVCFYPETYALRTPLMTPSQSLSR